MKNIQSSQNCAPQRGNSSKPPTLFFGGGVALFNLPAIVLTTARQLSIIILMLFAMWCFAPEVAWGQQSGPGTAWTAGVNFKSNSPAGEDTWAFDAVEMGNGDFVVVGYAEINNAANRVPAYAVLDKFGTLKHSFNFASSDAGAFAQIAKTADGGCVMAGWQGTQALLFKLNQDYLVA